MKGASESGPSPARKSGSPTPEAPRERACRAVFPEACARDEGLNRLDLPRIIAGAADAFALRRCQGAAVETIQDREAAKRLQAGVCQWQMGGRAEQGERKSLLGQNARQWVPTGECEHRDFEVCQRFFAHRLSPFLPETPAPSTILIKKRHGRLRHCNGHDEKGLGRAAIGATCSLRPRHRIVRGRLRG